MNNRTRMKCRAAMMQDESIVEDFIKFMEREHNIIMTAKKSEHGESFADLYGYDFSDDKPKEDG